jgi:hypothetical protein
MKLIDSMVIGREKVINGVLGVDLSHTLNPDLPLNLEVYKGTDLAKEIKNAITQFKIKAMDESGGLVDYQKLANLDEYQSYRSLTSRLQNFDYTKLKTEKEQKAFWINIYNSMVIDAVIQFGVKDSVIESPLGILSFFQKVAYVINGLRFSLTDIEHGVLRGNRGFPFVPGPHFSHDDPRLAAMLSTVDPRIHFALNCASKSCPPIIVYSPQEIDAQLDLATKNFILSDLLLNKKRKTISISRIFQWYRVDFNRKIGGIDFLLTYIQDPDIKEWLVIHQDQSKIIYHHYDWGLNHFKLS